MNPILLASLINQLGTVGIPLILKLKADIEAGKAATTVTDADLKEVARLAALSAADIFKANGAPLPV